MGNRPVSALIEWIIYYDEGTFSSLDGDPHEAPREGAQVLATRSGDVGRALWHGFDYYCWQGEWVPRNLIGLHHYLRQPGREKVVVQGTGIPFETFKAILRRAADDNRLPEKQGRLHEEPELPAL